MFELDSKPYLTDADISIANLAKGIISKRGH